MDSFWAGFEKQAFVAITSGGGIAGGAGGALAGATAGHLLSKKDQSPEGQAKHMRNTNRGALVGMGLGSVAGHLLQHKTLRNVGL